MEGVAITEVASLKEGKWSCYRGCHFNGGRKVIRGSEVVSLTLTLPGKSAGVSGALDSYYSLKPLCSGMGEVVPARTSPTLPPSTVLSLSCFKVSRCNNCHDWHYKS